MDIENTNDPQERRPSLLETTNHDTAYEHLLARLSEVQAKLDKGLSFKTIPEKTLLTIFPPEYLKKFKVILSNDLMIKYLNLKQGDLVATVIDYEEVMPYFSYRIVRNPRK